ncbi:AP-5 complex subunit beta-1-like isoform X2 [Dreissena polymorpha]|nr:AP-5 complex subunit beta-1-like isoform X2 [Dreissena polymorpha]
MYDDSEKLVDKFEILVALEEYGHLGISSESVDQVVTSLLDVYHQAQDKSEASHFVCQLLTTCTSLIIQMNQLESDLCDLLVKELVAIVTSRVNQLGSENLRSCACQSLLLLEETSPGVVLGYYEELVQCCRQERSHMFQDYCLLTSRLMESFVKITKENPMSPVVRSKGKVQRQFSADVTDMRQTVSYLVENVPMFTRSATFRVIHTLSNLIKTSTDLSPIIFKSLMLHEMSTMSCIVFHTALYLQRVFKGTLLTVQEESNLVQRLCLMTNHPCLNQLHRQLTTQWALGYKQFEDEQMDTRESLICQYRLQFYPSVFDSVDCQLAKLYMTSLCVDTSSDNDGIETSILLGSLGCLHKLVWHTGSMLAARALFRALYFIYTRHNNPHFSQDIQRFVRGLISEFAHFIPHSIDFVDSIHGLNINSDIFVETLSLLHQQVIMATGDQIYTSFPYYLQIMKKVASQPKINQSSTLKFLNYLSDNAQEIDDSSWQLGHNILDICRNVIINQGTQLYYSDLCELLYSLLTDYNNTDVQDQAKLYYCLLIAAADSKVKSVLQPTQRAVDSMSQALSSLLPGTTGKSSLAKIVHMEGPVFTWERLCVTPQWFVSDTSTQTSEQSPDSVAEYIKRLSTLEVVVEVKCRLHLVDACSFPAVHAVSISVEDSLTFQHIPKVHVPCISKGAHHDTVLKVKPLQAIPIALNSFVDFCADTKQTFTTSMPAVTVEFVHFMLPLPWKQSKEFKFEELWNYVVEPYNDKPKGLKSVKLFEVTAEQFMKIHHQRLAKYLVSSSPDYSDTRYAMLVPPRSHVLLQCEGQGHTVVVTMAMDQISVLPHVSSFLENVFTVSHG